MIDWMTLRIPMDATLGEHIHSKLQSFIGRVVLIAPDGSKVWEKPSLDTDALRSDTPGLFWSVQGDGEGRSMLVIGASPASIEHGINVFGSDDVTHCARVLIRFAGEALGGILPAPSRWECRRIDVTHNYDMGAFTSVKQALRYLMATDSSRRKASNDSRGGDTVYWSKTSDLRSGKAYHKGPQLAFLCKKNKTQATDEQIALSNRLLRLELKLGSRWFRRLEAGELVDLPTHYLALTPDMLNAQHAEFFHAFIGRIEVTDMTNLLSILETVSPSPGISLAAHRTWALIRTIGYEQAKASMPARTWGRHVSLLRAAGLSDADLCAGNVIPFRRTVLELAQPVICWDDLRKSA